MTRQELLLDLLDTETGALNDDVIVLNVEEDKEYLVEAVHDTLTGNVIMRVRGYE